MIVKRLERLPDARTDLVTVRGVVARAASELHVIGVEVVQGIGGNDWRGRALWFEGGAVERGAKGGNKCAEVIQTKRG